MKHSSTSTASMASDTISSERRQHGGGKKLEPNQHATLPFSTLKTIMQGKTIILPETKSLY